MTMPHLMNCAHSDDGWCLDCVEELWNKTQVAPEMLTVAATGIVKLSRDFWTMPGGLITDGFVIADKSQQAAQAALEAAGVPALMAKLQQMEASYEVAKTELAATYTLLDEYRQAGDYLHALKTSLVARIAELERELEPKLPTIEEMSGLIEDFTGGKSLKEYMEELSNEEI